MNGRISSYAECSSCQVITERTVRKLAPLDTAWRCSQVMRRAPDQGKSAWKEQ
jgi:hypothetical protein